MTGYSEEKNSSTTTNISSSSSVAMAEPKHTDLGSKEEKGYLPNDKKQPTHFSIQGGKKGRSRKNKKSNRRRTLRGKRSSRKRR